MTSKSFHTLIATAFIFHHIAGCNFGGQTGEGDDIGPLVCDVTSSSQIAWDEQTALGFSANDLLPLIERRSIQGQWFTSWITDDPDQLGAPSPDVAPIPVETTIRIVPETDFALFVETAPSHQVNGETRCSARLEAEVTATLRMESESAATQAVFPATLIARSKELVEINATLASESVPNDLPLPLMEGEWIERYYFTSLSSESWISGAFKAELAHTEYPAGWGTETTSASRGDAPVAKPSEARRSVLAARWPVDNPCAVGELSLPFDASIFGVTLANAIPIWSTDLPFVWNEDGTETRLHLTAEARSDTVCIEDPCDDGCSPFALRIIPFEDRASMTIAVYLTIRTEDGRWNGRLPALLKAEILHSGGFAKMAIFESLSFASASEFASAIGFTPATWEAGKQATFHLELESDAASGSSEPYGRMTVGVPEIKRDCEGEQNTCLPYTFLTTIQSATIGDPDRRLYTR